MKMLLRNIAYCCIQSTRKVLLISSSMVLIGCIMQGDTGYSSYSSTHRIYKQGQNSISAYLIFQIQANIHHRKIGLAHYVEHLAWFSNFPNIDQHSNAWTNSLTTGYWLSGRRDNFNNMLVTLSGVLDPINVSREFAQEERSIVLREYERRMANNVDAQAREVMKLFLYKKNTIADSILGSPQSISEFDYNSAKALHAATHRLDKAVLVVVGDITEREVNSAVEKMRLSVLLEKSKKGPPPQFKIAEPKTEIFKFHGNNSEPRLLWRKVVTLSKAVDFDLLELQTRLLGSVLEANLPGGLAGGLRYEQFIARSFTIHIRPLDEQHIELRFEATPDSDVSFQQLQVAFEGALKAATIGIPKSTFKRTKKRLESYWPDWTNDQETADWMAKYVLKRVSNLREPLTEEMLRGLHDRLSLDDLNVLLQSFQKPGRQAVAFIGNNKGEVE